MSYGECIECSDDLLNGQGLCGACTEGHEGEAFHEGAAVAFGLMGMAEAIRQAEHRRFLEADAENHDCTCPGSWSAEYCNCSAGLYP